MPMFRVTGDYRAAFIHTIEADNDEGAEDKVAALRFAQLDTIDCGEITTDGCVLIDEKNDED